ncbi:hypothetical protein B0T17DRAFT_497172 [Bombardia bombarda]|uniref:MYND-type domain-containing protein n=1 Tax=Bombardia bombarda TaxID=252184 RepID=A0AA40BVV6_9PEZI|nr:hypothetical protein B0T17DRAFT_497172 [Bombardia bombarda]
MDQALGKRSDFDKARFDGLAKLLRLRYHGQVEAPSRAEDLWQDDEAIAATNDLAEGHETQQEQDSAHSTKAATLADFNSDRLKRFFLDRLAELVANEKGGRHVTATMMITGPDKVTVLIAKNNGLRPRDKHFLDIIAAQLREIARGSDPVRQLLKAFIQAYGSDEPTALPAESPLSSQLKKIHSSLFGSHDSTLSRNETLVLQAHGIYRTFSDDDFADLSSPRPQKLRECLGLLGRLRTAFAVLVRSAERLPGFADFTISTIQQPQSNGKAKPSSPEAWTLTQVFHFLGRRLDDNEAQVVMSSSSKKTKWTKNKLIQDFNSLKSSSREIHAEIQLMPRYIEATTLAHDSVFQYIGCSKRSCFLCWHFLRLFAHISTRGCHGKLYNLWNVPDFQGLSTVDTPPVMSALRRLESLIKRELLGQEMVILPQAKESTVGGSSVSTRVPHFEDTSLSSIAKAHLENERANRLWKNTNANPAYEDSRDIGAASMTELMSDGNSSAKATSGRCANRADCGKNTTRRCSHCNGAWYCSVSCEDADVYSHKYACNRRPITTADYLQDNAFEDLIPQDPQTREDYGFHRCRDRKEESHLFGLYQGLLKGFDVSSEKLHSWRTEGTLVENIVELYSGVSEAHRGKYYPWFLQHRYILEQQDDASIPAPLSEDEYIAERFADARQHLDPDDRDREISDLTPFGKQYCFMFFAMILGNTHFPPSATHLDIWFDLGFVVCPGTDDEEISHHERALGGIYHELLAGNKGRREYFQSLNAKYSGPADTPTCSFSAFWKAWEQGTLFDLFDSHSTHTGQTFGELFDYRFPDLRVFLTYPGKHPRPSLYKLRHFLAIKDANVLNTALPLEIRHAALEHGFHPTLDARTRLDLHNVYMRLLHVGLSGQGLSLQIVDKIKAEGSLREYATLYLGDDISESVQSILKGVPYDTTNTLPEIRPGRHT